jgi:c-di-GMP-binding flagellar brake protein YcgR
MYEDTIPAGLDDLPALPPRAHGTGFGALSPVPARDEAGVASDALDTALAAFRVAHAQDRITLLRQLRDSAAPIILSAPGGANVATTLWSLDAAADRLHLATEPQHPHLERLLDAGEATAVSYLDSVKLQFEVHSPVLVRARGSASLQCPFPRELYRFQRRNAFRVRASERHAPMAYFRHPSWPEMQLSLRLIDLSAGGCALWLPQDVPPLQAGTQLAEVGVALDPQTRFAAALTLQQVGDYYPGDEGVRLHCAWQPLSAEAARALQRWIDQSQKRHRMVHIG